MGCSGKMDPVPLQEISRYHWVKNDDADMTPPQLINDGRNISGALFLRPEETEIIVPGCRMTILVLLGTSLLMRLSMPAVVLPMTPALVTIASMPRSLRMVCNRAGKAFSAPTPQPTVF